MRWSLTVVVVYWVPLLHDSCDHFFLFNKLFARIVSHPHLISCVILRAHQAARYHEYDSDYYQHNAQKDHPAKGLIVIGHRVIVEVIVVVRVVVDDEDRHIEIVACVIATPLGIVRTISRCCGGAIGVLG